MPSKVVPSVAAPSKVWERRTKPLPSSTSHRATSGQSLRFSLERPRCALGLGAAPPLEKRVGQLPFDWPGAGRQGAMASDSRFDADFDESQLLAALGALMTSHCDCEAISSGRRCHH